MLVDQKSIEFYIPHRAPFIMVDALVDATESEFDSVFEIKPDNIFIDDAVLREFALIENICQTAAAGLSYTQRHSKKHFKDGFLGSITKLIVHELPVVGSVVQTKVIKKQQLGSLYLMRGETFSNGKKLLECEVKLAEKND